MRTVIEKQDIAPRGRNVGNSVRYAFEVKDRFYVKLLSDLPLDLGREDKRSLRDLVFHHAESAGRWHAEGPDFVLRSGDLVHVEVKRLRQHPARNLSTYHRGRRRIPCPIGTSSAASPFLPARAFRWRMWRG